MRHRVSFVASAILLAAETALFAQNGPDSDPDDAQGYVNNVFHHSEVDSINLYNGQLTVPIAIGPSYPIGPNLKFQATLTYNSRVWEYGHPNSISYPGPGKLYLPITGDPALGIGWRFSLGAIKTCHIDQNFLCYVGPDGAEHIFYGAKTVDGAQLYLRAINGDPNQGYEMWDGDGNHHVFGWKVWGFDDKTVIDPGDANYDFWRDFGRGRDGWYLTSLSDPFGNAMTVSYYQNLGTLPCWTYPAGVTGSMRCPALANSWIPQYIRTPSTGATPIHITLDANDMVASVDFPVNGGQRFATWRFVYGTMSYGRVSPNASSINLRTLASLQLPSDIRGFSGQSSAEYDFTYVPGGTNASGAQLQTMKPPTGATVSYRWGRYTFHHGRRALLPNCAPQLPPPGLDVVLSGRAAPGLLINAGTREAVPLSHRTALLPIECDPAFNPLVWSDTMTGVIRRTVSMTGSADASTDYVQFAFPYGEQGSSPTSNCDVQGHCGPQTLTLMISPVDLDGKVHAAGTLFQGVIAHDGSTTPGDPTGADIRIAMYDFDPYGFPPSLPVISQPACGGGDNTFCPHHAIRVRQRTFQYDYPAVCCNRHLKSETVFYGPTQSNGQCTACMLHAVDYSVPPSKILSGQTEGQAWDANGRHFDVETHTGNLGNDIRTITTNWTPVNWLTGPPVNGSVLMNLYDHKSSVEGSSIVDRYFEFDRSNGFLKGTELHDASRQRIFLTCRYGDGRGNAGQEFSATYPNQPSPILNACSTYYPTIPSLPANGDAFGKFHTYLNGLRMSTRWISGTTPAAWFAFDVTRDSSTGWIAAARDTAGLATTYSYDSIGRPTSIAPPGEAATTVSYPSPAQTTATRNGGIGLSTYEEYDYDGLGRTVRERRLMPGSVFTKRFTKFDLAGNVYFGSEWVDDATSETLSSNLSTTCGFSTGSFATTRPTAAPGTYSQCFDPFGRAQQLVGSMHSSLRTISRVDGAVFYSDTQEAVTTSCLNGSWSAGTCSGGSNSLTTLRRDAFGRMTSAIEPGGDVTTYGHDVNARLTSVSQGVQARSFVYDPAGFLRSETTPEGGTVSYTNYGSLGNVLSTTSPGGVVESRAYDFAGHVLSVATNEAGGRTYLQNVYENASNAEGYSLGKLISAASYNYAAAPTTSVADSYRYDGTGGRLSSRSTIISGAASQSVSQTWKYNALGLVAHHTHPRPAGSAPFAVSTVYDAGLTATEYLNGIPMIKAVGYAPSGALKAYTSGAGTGHDVTTTIVPDSSLLSRPAQIYSTEQASGSRLFDTGAYGYDGAANVRLMGADSFGYDLRSRLTTSTLSGLGAQTFGYDRYGNLTFRSIGGSPVNYPTDAATNHLTNVVYDPRGNVIQNGGETFIYDGFNRMVQATTTATWKYIFDAASERVAKLGPTGSFTFTHRDERKRLVSEFSDGTWSRDDVFLGPLLVASYANASVSGNGLVWTFTSSDHLNTPRLVTDLPGTVVETRKYWPYGDEATAQSTFQRLRFASMERDAEGTRYYDHARSHDFGIARFLSPDLLSGSPARPQSWNRYSYAWNNPLKLVDLTGLAPVKPVPQWVLEREAAKEIGKDVGRDVSKDAAKELGKDRLQESLDKKAGRASTEEQPAKSLGEKAKDAAQFFGNVLLGYVKDLVLNAGSGGVYGIYSTIEDAVPLAETAATAYVEKPMKSATEQDPDKVNHAVNEKAFLKKYDPDTGEQRPPDLPCTNHDSSGCGGPNYSRPESPD